MCVHYYLAGICGFNNPYGLWTGKRPEKWTGIWNNNYDSGYALLFNGALIWLMVLEKHHLKIHGFMRRNTSYSKQAYHMYLKCYKCSKHLHPSWSFFDQNTFFYLYCACVFNGWVCISMYALPFVHGVHWVRHYCHAVYISIKDWALYMYFLE